jgi:hypothetical protein
MNRLFAAQLDAGKIELAIRKETWFARDDFLGRATLAVMYSGTANTCGAKTPCNTPQIGGPSVQEHLTTCARILRRRNSSAC